jgi:hypothetical protein
VRYEETRTPQDEGRNFRPPWAEVDEQLNFKKDYPMISRDQVKEWFPDEDILLVPVAALPPALVNEPARNILTGAGLPESVLDVVELDVHITERIRTVGEVYRSHEEDPPGETGRLLYLGLAGQPFLCLDGDTGEVAQVHEDFGTRPFATSLEAFIRVLGFVNTEVQKYQLKKKRDPEKFAIQLWKHTAKQLSRVDPAALPEAERAWQALLNDIAATAE